MNYNILQDRERISEKIFNAYDTSVTHWCSALSFACLADRISRFCLSISSKRERQSKECKNWSKTVRSRDKGTFTFHEVEWTKDWGKVTRLKNGSLSFDCSQKPSTETVCKKVFPILNNAHLDLPSNATFSIVVTYSRQGDSLVWLDRDWVDSRVTARSDHVSRYKWSKAVHFCSRIP